MRTIETTFNTFGASVLLIGLKGDSNATEILIDCADALEEYQGTMAAMSITGPDETVYPGDISLDEDGIVHWVVAARDCGIAGHGSARVDLVDDLGTVVASAEARTIVMKTNMQGIAPDQIANWTEAASVALQEVRAALLDLIDNDESAIANEAARQLAETGRVSAETLRASAETARASAETARATAETARASAETLRASAETDRASAETARVSAETARVSEFSTMQANAQAALSYIGPSEDSSTASAAHAAGSYFIYNGKLYQATADIAIGDTITSGTNCAQVPGGAMGEVSNLKSATIETTGNEIISFTPDNYIATNGDVGTVVNINNPQPSSSHLGYAVLDAKPWDVFTIYGVGGSSGRLWCWIDSADKIIDKAQSSSALYGEEITAPANAAKLIINRTETTHLSYVGSLLEKKSESLFDSFVEMPFLKKEIIVKTGTSHTSTSDRLCIDIKQGETFRVTADKGTIVLHYIDGTTETLSSLDYIGSRNKDIVSVGVYYSNNTGNDTTVTISAMSSMGYEIYNNTNKIENIDRSVYRTNSENNHLLFYDNGDYTNTNSIDSSEMMSIQTGDVIVFTAENASSYHALLFYDSGCNVIATFGSGKVVGGTYTVENVNIAYVRFQSRNENYPATVTPIIKIYKAEIGKEKQIRIYKRSSSIFDIFVPNGNGSVVQYEFDKYYKKWDTLTYIDSDGNTQTATNIVSSDYWNNLYVKNGKTGNAFAQGHTNFISKVQGEPYYIGNGHGNEVTIAFSMLADGKEIDIDSMQSKNSVLCSELRILAKSKMYECESYSSGEHMGAKPKLDTSGNPVVDFIHVMEISYEIGNKVTIHNKLLVMKNNLKFIECHGAMLDCNYGTFDTVICGNAESTRNHIASDGTCTTCADSTINLRTNNVQYAHVVEMFGEDYYISQRMTNDNAQDIGKSSVYFEFYSGDLKCYFTPVRTSHRYPSGTTQDIFNAGDVISVTDVREVDLFA